MRKTLYTVGILGLIALFTPVTSIAVIRSASSGSSRGCPSGFGISSCSCVGTVYGVEEGPRQGKCKLVGFYIGKSSCTQTGEGCTF